MSTKLLALEHIWVSMLSFSESPSPVNHMQRKAIPPKQKNGVIPSQINAKIRIFHVPHLLPSDFVVSEANPRLSQYLLQLIGSYILIRLLLLR